MNKQEIKERIKNGERAQAVREKLTQRTPKCAEVKTRGTGTLASEIVQTVDLPHPIYIGSAEGPNLTDIDGNEYIDLTGGFGPCVLGNRPAVVEEALAKQIKKGWHYGLPCEEQLELAEIIKDAGACVDQVLFCNTGTEAVMYAMRAARAFTGKQKIATFGGSYHGAEDYELIKEDFTSDPNAPAKQTMGAGIPPVIADLMMVLPYRNSAAFDLIREHKDELALVMIEPAQSSNPRTDCGDFLRELKKVCTECGVLFMFDEVITGFRMAYGGCQEYYDIKPDLASYGKAIGGGMPIGAVGGRKDIMNVFSGTDDAPYTFAGGTFGGNPMTMTAGLAAGSYMQAHKDEIYPYLEQQGDRFAQEVNDYCESNQIAAQLMNAGSMFHLLFTANEVNAARDIDRDKSTIEREFYLHLLGHDVIVPGIHLGFLSYAHKESDVDTVVDAFKASFDDLRVDGLI
ncbi:MAG: aminotransferase class III-fold pyridoxal phosphate-dependent enzyme [Pseudomonadota bacterium]